MNHVGCDYNTAITATATMFRRKRICDGCSKRTSCLRRNKFFLPKVSEAHGCLAFTTIRVCAECQPRLDADDDAADTEANMAFIQNLLGGFDGCDCDYRVPY